MTDSNANNDEQSQNKISEMLQYLEGRRTFRKASWQVSPIGRISREVTESLDGESQEKITKYLDWLYGNISNSIQSIKQSTVLVLGLMVAFELIANSGSTARVTIFSVGVPKHSIIAQFIPAAVAFLYLQLSRDSVDINRSRVAFSRAFELWTEKSDCSNLDEYIWPSSRLYWSPFEKDESKESANVAPVMGRTGYAFRAIFDIAFLAFLGQAYYAVFVPHLNGSLALWAVSLFFTLFCLWAEFFLSFEESGLWEMIRTLRMAMREAKNSEPRPDSPIH